MDDSINSHIDSPELAQPTRAALAVAMLNALAFALLIGSEAFFFALSLDWSLAGLLNLGPAIYLPLGAVLAGAASWLSIWAFRSAWRVEHRLAMFGDKSV